MVKIILKNRLFIFICLICVIRGNLSAQNRSIDSLKLALKNAKHDTTMVSLYCLLAQRTTDPDSAIKLWKFVNTFVAQKESEHSNNILIYKTLRYYSRISLSNSGNYYKSQGKYLLASECFQKAIDIDEELKNNLDVAADYCNLASVLALHGNTTKALDYYQKSLVLFEKEGNKKELAFALSNIGLLYQELGNINRTLECYESALRILERLDDKEGIAQTLTNFGYTSFKQKDFDKAIEYYEKALKIRLKTGKKKGIYNSLNNLAAVYKEQNEINKALEYNFASLKLKEEVGDKRAIAISFNNIASCYSALGDLEKAMEYHLKSLKIREEAEEKKGVCNSLSNIAMLYYEKKELKKANEYATRSMKLSKELGYPEHIQSNASVLCRLYRTQGNFKLALENYELYIQMRDSVNNESNKKATLKSQLKYEYEKQAAADSVVHAKESEIKNAELAKQKAEIKAKKNQQYALFGGLFAVCVFGAFMYNRFKVTQKQKEIIEEQKEVVEEQKKLVEEKQKEVLDSIHYAKKIQMAQIPSEKQVGKNLEKLRKT